MAARVLGSITPTVSTFCNNWRNSFMASIFHGKLFLQAFNCFSVAMKLKNGKNPTFGLDSRLTEVGSWLVVDSGSRLAREMIQLAF